MIALFFSTLGALLGLAVVVWLVMLVLDLLFQGVGATEWTEQPSHVRLVSTSPEGCRVCGVAGMHAMDCARHGLDGAA